MNFTIYGACNPGSPDKDYDLNLGHRRKKSWCLSFLVKSEEVFFN